MDCIDLFSGGGGFSIGARMAGLTVKWAGNHWPTAVEVHKANVPEAIHICQDLHQADWTKVPNTDIILGSPCCQGHSRARGKDRPHHDQQRSTAWAMVSAAEYLRPKAVVIENVGDFGRWVLYPAWVNALQSLGYTLSSEILDAQYFGIPQLRKRLFIVAQLNGKSFDFRGLGGQVPRPVSSILDLDSGQWSPWDSAARIQMGRKPLVPATMERITNGLKRHGKNPFFFPYFGANKNGWTIEAPIWCITTRDRYALVKDGHFRVLTVDECRRAMGFPESYRLTGNVHTDKMLLGNAVVPQVAAEVLRRLAA